MKDIIPNILNLEASSIDKLEPIMDLEDLVATT